MSTCYCPDALTGGLSKCGSGSSSCGTSSSAYYNSTSGVQLCCATANGDQCGADSLCHFNPAALTLKGAYSGFYLGGCTDPTYADPLCASPCRNMPTQDVVFNSTTGLWYCCSRNAGDNQVNCDSQSPWSFPGYPPDQFPALDWTLSTVEDGAQTTPVVRPSSSAIQNVVVTQQSLSKSTATLDERTATSAVAIPSSISSSAAGPQSSSFSSHQTSLSRTDASSNTGSHNGATSVSETGILSSTSALAKNSRTNTPDISNTLNTPGISTGELTGIVVGGVVLLGLILLGGYYFLRRRRGRTLAGKADIHTLHAFAVEKGEDKVYTAELAGDGVVAEMFGQDMRHELHSKALVGYSPGRDRWRHEMPG